MKKIFLFSLVTLILFFNILSVAFAQFPTPPNTYPIDPPPTSTSTPVIIPSPIATPTPMPTPIDPCGANPALCLGTNCGSFDKNSCPVGQTCGGGNRCAVKNNKCECTPNF